MHWTGSSSHLDRDVDGRVCDDAVARVHVHAAADGPAANIRSLTSWRQENAVEGEGADAGAREM